jgi:hypothetical protein
MDIYSTASTAIRDIYAISVLIRETVRDVKQRSQDLSDIQNQLEHEFLFVETFNILFFGDDNHSGPWFRSLSKNFQRDFNNSLTALKSCLDAYENVALKHGLNLSEANASLGREDKQAQQPPALDIPPNQRHKDKAGRFQSKVQEVRSKLEGKIKKFQEGEVLKGLEWALIDKDEVKKLVGQYREWTEKLRQTMNMVLLAKERLGSYATVELGVDAGAQVSKALGVDKMVRRQVRAKSEHPEDFPALNGYFESDGGHAGSTSTYTIGTFTDLDKGPYQAIMEIHDFVIVDSTKSEIEKQEMKLELVRRLAWLLEGDISATESTDPDSGTTPMYLLDCLGYYSLHGEELSLIYKVPPQGSTPKSLHDWIIHDEQREYELVQREKSVRENENSPEIGSKDKLKNLRDKYKIVQSRKALEAERHKHQPNLSERYFLAWALASTLYNIHASGWVHKNIWSRTILVFQTPSKERNVPYLLGWSVSRPQTEEFRNVSKFKQDKDSPEPDGPKNDDTDYTPKTKRQTEETTDPDSDSDGELEPAKTQQYDLEHELYSHPDRYQGGTATYENKHDIYSLGVCLLEIGLWSTVSMEMSTAILRVKQTESPPSAYNLVRLQEKIISKSLEPQLAQQMGPGYAEIVRRCLTGSFECLNGHSGTGNEEREDRGDAELAREFFKLVVEPLRLKASLF